MPEDDGSVRVFEARTLPKAQFSHAAHVRATSFVMPDAGTAGTPSA